MNASGQRELASKSWSKSDVSDTHELLQVYTSPLYTHLLGTGKGILEKREKKPSLVVGKNTSVYFSRFGLTTCSISVEATRRQLVKRGWLLGHSYSW